MEAFGEGLALDEYGSHLRAYKRIAYELKGNDVKRQTKIEHGKYKIRLRIVDLLSFHNVNAVVWLPILVCLKSLISAISKTFCGKPDYWCQCFISRHNV